MEKLTGLIGLVQPFSYLLQIGGLYLIYGAVNNSPIIPAKLMKYAKSAGVHMIALGFALQWIG